MARYYTNFFLFVILLYPLKSSHSIYSNYCHLEKKNELKSQIKKFSCVIRYLTSLVIEILICLSLANRIHISWLFLKNAVQQIHTYLYQENLSPEKSLVSIQFISRYQSVPLVKPFSTSYATSSKSSNILFIYFFIYFYQLEANYFTILWWFLPYIDMNQPWIYMYSPSQSPIPPPSPSHPSGSSHALVSCIQPRLVIYFTLARYLFQCYSLRTSHLFKHFKFCHLDIFFWSIAYPFFKNYYYLTTSLQHFLPRSPY